VITAKPFTADIFAGLGEVGLIGTQFVGALSCWVWMQQRDVTVAEAANVFNITPEIVVEAVNAHPWMFLAGAEGAGPELQFIEHDGA
jgi:hypothetical protein